jgi:hypothetical protein
MRALRIRSARFGQGLDVPRMRSNPSLAARTGIRSVKIVFGYDKLPPGTTFNIDGVTVDVADWKRIQAALIQKSKPKGRDRAWGMALVLVLGGITLWIQFVTGNPLLGMMAAVACVIATMVVVFVGSARIGRQRRRVLLREYGYEVCLGCGYWLKDLAADRAKCPECGASRQTMPPCKRDASHQSSSPESQ